jgi:hypothetical protein
MNAMSGGAAAGELPQLTLTSVCRWPRTIRMDPPGARDTGEPYVSTVYFHCGEKRGVREVLN